MAILTWIMEKAKEFQKNIYFCFIDYAKAFDCVDHNKLWKILKEMGIWDHLIASWETYMQVRKQQFIVIHTVKGFGIVNKAELDVFLELSCFFDDPMDVGNLISGSSAFSKSSLNIRKLMYCWSLAWRILSITLLACEMSANVQ